MTADEAWQRFIDTVLTDGGRDQAVLLKGAVRLMIQEEIERDRQPTGGSPMPTGVDFELWDKYQFSLCDSGDDRSLARYHAGVYQYQVSSLRAAVEQTVRDEMVDVIEELTWLVDQLSARVAALEGERETDG